MRSSACLSLLALPLSISALQIPSLFTHIYAPFLASTESNPILLSNSSLIPESHDLLKRDGNCALNYNSCSTYNANYAGACCTAGSFCTTDGAKNVACCPTGATCTGSVDRGTATATTGTGSTTAGGVVFGSAGTTTTSTTTAATNTITSAATLSTVPNAFFPFPIIPTDYVNSQACMTAYSNCQSNLAACTANLEGGAFAVTVVAPGGGVTVSPTAQNLGTASANSICTSLYNAGCYGLVPSNCNQFGTGTGTGFVVATTTNAGARQTMGCFATMGVMAGVGIGVMRQMI